MAQSRLLDWHVWLVDSEPPIWRRFRVSEAITLAELHQVLQLVMGWQAVHPYVFQWQGDRYAPAKASLSGSQDAGSVTLASLSLAITPTLSYTYDLQDGWLHRLTLEHSGVPDSSVEPAPPCCLAGARACPPERCGGIWGYESLLARLEDPEDPDYEALLDWLGGDFDPEAFSLAAVNQQLHARAACR